MIHSRKIIVSLSSFGASNVRVHGQRRYVRLCHEAGADGVEIRGELLCDAQRELPDLSAYAHELGLSTVYSSPDMLWDNEGCFDHKALERGISSAATLQAPVLKMSIGAFGPTSAVSLTHLRDILSDAKTELLIENDQTIKAGSVSALRNFFGFSDDAGLRLGMTFDMGNWHWVGECSLRAAEAFATRVRYVHCKGVQRHPRQWVAVPLNDSVAPWLTVLNQLPPAVPKAIEYPLDGNDILGATRCAVRGLRMLEIP